LNVGGLRLMRRNHARIRDDFRNAAMPMRALTVVAATNRLFMGVSRHARSSV